MINTYELKARKFPAIITLLPALIFSHFYLYKIIPEFFDSILLTKIVGDFSIILIMLYLVEQTSRFISKKYLQDNIFKNEFHFPTTNYLLYSDKKYSTDQKEKIRKKIKDDFNINLLNQNEENNNEDDARKKIKEAVDLIRNKVKSGYLLLQHNIEYGFVRNLIGGTTISIPISIFNIIFFYLKENSIVTTISIILFMCYLIIILNKKKILLYYAHNYASILYNEYLSKI